jgi:hypothetical protein
MLPKIAYNSYKHITCYLNMSAPTSDNQASDGAVDAVAGAMAGVGIASGASAPAAGEEKEFSTREY